MSEGGWVNRRTVEEQAAIDQVSEALKRFKDAAGLRIVAGWRPYEVLGLLDGEGRWVWRPEDDAEDTL